MKEKKVNPGRIPVFKQRFNELAEEYDNNTLFADAIGLSRQTVNFWLNGDRTPDAESLKTISEKLNVSVDWLLGIAPHDVRTPNPEEKAACEYTGLSEKAIENIHELTLGMSEMEGEKDGAIDILGVKLDQILSLDVKILANMLCHIWRAQLDMEDHRKLVGQKPGNKLYELSIKTDGTNSDGRKILSHYHSAKAEIQDIADTLFSLCEIGHIKDGES